MYRTWYHVVARYKRIHEYLGCWQFNNGSKTAYFAGAQWQRVKSRIYDLLPDKFLVTFWSLFAFKQHAHAMYIRVYINKYVYRQMVRPPRRPIVLLDFGYYTLLQSHNAFLSSPPLSHFLFRWDLEKRLPSLFCFFLKKKNWRPTLVDFRPSLVCFFRCRLNNFYWLGKRMFINRQSVDQL